MFTGIVEEIGTVKAVRRGAASCTLQIAARQILTDLKLGDSVATNGVCLTVTKLEADGFCADVMHESLQRSSLGTLRTGSRVNLERAMAADGRFGGHIVSGHIDATGSISAIRRDDTAIWYTVTCAPALLRYVIEKGSITIDGISLTVAQVSAKDFSVSVIPHTAAHTTLADARIGTVVNLEADVLGKYIERLLTPQHTQRPEPQISTEFLAKFGF